MRAVVFVLALALLQITSVSAKCGLTYYEDSMNVFCNDIESYTICKSAEEKLNAMIIQQTSDRSLYPLFDAKCEQSISCLFARLSDKGRFNVHYCVNQDAVDKCESVKTETQRLVDAGALNNPTQINCYRYSPDDDDDSIGVYYYSSDEDNRNIVSGSSKVIIRWGPLIPVCFIIALIANN